MNNLKILHISDIDINLYFRRIVDSPENLFTTLKGEFEKIDLFVINVNYLFNGSSRTDNNGILFLKYLRLNHFNQHCVLYSFLSREQLMDMDSRNLILFSKGITFARMPEDLSLLDFNLLVKATAPSDLSSYFKAEFNLPDDQHFFANWWGVLQLWNVQKEVEEYSKKNQEEDFETQLFGTIQEMKSYQALVALYIKWVNSKTIGESFKSKVSKNNNLLANRNELILKKPSIVLVDDKADEGWSLILQRIIYGGNCEKFHTIQPNKEEPIDDIARRITEYISSNNPELLILDLRLKGEKGNIPIQEISGIKVLEKILASEPKCPILITTASNKIWSYKKTLSAGADAYLIKQGLDDNVDTDMCVENYLRLIQLIYVLCYSDEYQFLYKELIPSILNIKQAKEPFWWETEFWKDFCIYYNRKNNENIVNPKSKLVSRKEIFEPLLLSKNLIKKKLSDKIESDDSSTSLDHTISLAIMTLSRTLETIYSCDDDELNNKISLFEKIKLFKPDNYIEISKYLTIRNKAVHNFSACFVDLQKFAKVLLTHLDLSVYKETNEPIHGNFYKSVVDSINERKVYLENPNLNLQSGRKNIILDLNKNEKISSANLKRGVMVEFKLRISSNKGTYSYFAHDAKIC